MRRFESYRPSQFKLISGSTSSKLAKKIAAALKLPLTSIQYRRFPDQEYNINLPELTGCYVSIVQTLAPKPHEQLCELLFLSAKAKAAGAKYITAVIPYLAYSRQDHDEFNGCQLIIELLETAHINNVITVDVHSSKLVTFATIPVHNVMPTTTIAKHLRINKIIPDKIIAPDLGATKRCLALGSALNLEVIILDKTKAPSSNLDKLKGKYCLIVDDILASGKTLLLTAKQLRQHGTKQIDAFCSHAVCPEPKKLSELGKLLTNIYFGNSVNNRYLCSWFNSRVKVLDFSQQLAAAIRQTQQIS